MLEKDALVQKHKSELDQIRYDALIEKSRAAVNVFLAAKPPLPPRGDLSGKKRWNGIIPSD